jgi:microcystin-dependent protein
MSTTEMRPAGTTPNLLLPYPGDSDPADGPGDIKKLADAIDLLAASGYVGWQPGDLKVSAAAVPTPGWLLCNGQAVSRTVYAALFAAIATTFGAGDGSSTFAVPDYRGRAIIGAGAGGGLTNRPLGSSGGAEFVALTARQSGVNPNGVSGWQSQNHSHGSPTGVGYVEGALPGNLTAYIIANFRGQAGDTGVRIVSATAIENALHQHVLLERNADESHNNMPPWATANVLIKT